MGVADGADPLRPGLAGPQRQVRSDPVLQLYRRYELLIGAVISPVLLNRSKVSIRQDIPRGENTLFPARGGSLSAANRRMDRRFPWVGVDPEKLVFDVAAIDAAGPDDLRFSKTPVISRNSRRRAPARSLFRRATPRRRPQAVRRSRTPQPYRAMAAAMTRLYPGAARPGSGLRRARRLGERACSPLGAARIRRRRRSRGGDRPRRPDRLRHGHRRECGDRPERLASAAIARSAREHDLLRADRRSRDHSPRRAYRSGRFRFRDRARAAI